MSDLQDHTARIREFCSERDWDQFHTSKDMALSLLLEAAEVLEHFQWKNEDEMREYLKEHKDDVAEELVDTYYWILRMCDLMQIDLPKAFDSKMAKNAEKYPVKKSKGRHAKYTQL